MTRKKDPEFRYAMKIITPLLTLGGKLSSAILMGSTNKPLSGYLLLSSLWDGREMYKNLSEIRDGGIIKSYNFFEKRVLSDLPKWTLKKVGIIKSKKELSSKI